MDQATGNQSKKVTAAFISTHLHGCVAEIEQRLLSPELLPLSPLKAKTRKNVNSFLWMPIQPNSLRRACNISFKNVSEFFIIHVFFFNIIYIYDIYRFVHLPFSLKLMENNCSSSISRLFYTNFLRSPLKKNKNKKRRRDFGFPQIYYQIINTGICCTCH